MKKTVMLAGVLVLFSLILCCCSKQNTSRPAPDDSVLAHNDSILKRYIKTDQMQKTLNDLLLASYYSGKLDDIQISMAHWEKNVQRKTSPGSGPSYYDYLVLDMAGGGQCWALSDNGELKALLEGSPEGALLSAVVE